MNMSLSIVQTAGQRWWNRYMPRYIDADAHKKFILSNEWKTHTQTSELIRLDNAPTADVEPVKHGRWIAISNGKMKHWKERCSVCEGITRGRYPYCRNCGARMDEEEL